jgi:hypothetical protein
MLSAPEDLNDEKRIPTRRIVLPPQWEENISGMRTVAFLIGT